MVSVTSGCASLMTLTPSGAATKNSAIMFLQPEAFNQSMVAKAVPPVANIGSITIAVLLSISEIIFS